MNEADFLDKLAREPRSNEVLEIYADWLEQRGEPVRARVLRATVLAAREPAMVVELSEALAHLDRSAREWSRVVGASLVRGILETHGPEPLDALMDLARPALIFGDYDEELAVTPYGRTIITERFGPVTEAEENPPPAGTFLWGDPDLPPDMPWPTAGDCLVMEDSPRWSETESRAKCRFLGQLNLAALGPLFSRLPSSGLLSFFGYLDEDRSWATPKVCYFPDTSILKRIDHPATNARNHRISPRAPRLTRALQLPAEGEPWRSSLPSSVDEDMYQQLGTAGDRRGFFGYLQPTTGHDPSPDVGWVRLACLSHSPDELIYYHMGIPETELEEGRFDLCRFVWVDLDG